MGAKIKCEKCGGDVVATAVSSSTNLTSKFLISKDILTGQTEKVKNSKIKQTPNQKEQQKQTALLANYSSLPSSHYLKNVKLQNSCLQNTGSNTVVRNAKGIKPTDTNQKDDYNYNEHQSRPLSLSLWSSVPNNLDSAAAECIVKELRPQSKELHNSKTDSSFRREYDTTRCNNECTKYRIKNVNKDPHEKYWDGNTRKIEVLNSQDRVSCSLNLADKSRGNSYNANNAVGVGRHGEKHLRKVVTLWQNYYPEGQWGWVILLCAFMVQITTHGSQLAYSIFWANVQRRFHVENPLLLGLVGGVSVSFSLVLSPLWISICKRKSTRLVAILGGMVSALAWLFTSFASQFHQLYFSYGIFLGMGVGLCRDASCLMIGGYFKRKREFVEMLIVAASGMGVICMSIGIHCGIRQFGWRLGLNAVAVVLLIPFIVGICYRSASLYHPQRRAILHLKNQRRKVKEKYKRDDGPPFFDWSCLNSVTLRILLLSSCLTAFGIHMPLFFLSFKCSELKIDQSSTLQIHTYLGVAWIFGSFLFGIVIIQKNEGCRVSKQYLCQGSGALCGLSILGLPFAEEFNGMRIFACIYGMGLGAHAYSVKVYTYERARARHFPRAWSFVQCAQGISIIGGTALTGLLFSWGETRIGFYISAGASILGSLLLFLADLRRKSLAARGKPTESYKAVTHPKKCNLALMLPPTLGEHMIVEDPRECSEGSKTTKNGSGCDVGHESFDSSLAAKNLASISEEGFADIGVDYDADFQDIYFEDWEQMVGLGADAITSCNKVENCLMSEAGEGDLDKIAYYVESQSSMKFESSKRRPNRRPYKAIQSISFPSLKVASGVVGMSTLDPRTDYRTTLCKIAESESLSSMSHFNSSSEQHQQQQHYSVSNQDPEPAHSSEQARGVYQISSQEKRHVDGEMVKQHSGNNCGTDLITNYLPVEIPSYESLQRRKRLKQTDT